MWRLELASVRHKSECPSRLACGRLQTNFHEPRACTAVRALARGGAEGRYATSPLAIKLDKIAGAIFLVSPTEGVRQHAQAPRLRSQPSPLAFGRKSCVKPKAYEQRVVYLLHYVGRKFAYFFFDSAFVYRANLL